MSLLDAGRVALDATNDLLTLDGDAVPLRGKPVRVLEALMMRAGQLVTKEELLAEVWDGRPHSDAVLTTAIKEVRQALNENPRAPWAIETVHGRGYRFLLPVVRREVAPAFTDDVSAATGSSLQTRWLFAVLALVVLLGAALGLRQLTHTKPGGAVDSVAVLPFDDLTTGSDHSWFAIGLTEELLNSLTRIEGLLVAARTSTMRFSGNSRDIREIGLALGVTHVIEGSVRNTSDGRVRLTAQLIRTEDGFHEWSQTWDRNLSPASVLAVQRDVSERIIDMMSEEPLAAPALEEPSTSIPGEAWRKLLMGRQLVARREADSIEDGLRLLDEAVTLVPDYGDAHGALANAYLYAAEAMIRTLDEAMVQAERHARRALELDAESVDGLLASAFLALARRDYAAALPMADAAVRIAPAHADAHRRRAIVLGGLGRLEESFAALARARALDPLTPIVIGNYTQLAFRTSRFDEAWAAAEENLRWNGDNHTAQSIMGELALRVGLYERALACLAASIDKVPEHPAIAGALGELYWRIGADDLAAQVSQGPAGWPVRAAVLLGRGERAAALTDADTLPFRGLTGITSFDVHYWASNDQEAIEQAMAFFDAFGDGEVLRDVGVLPDNAVPALAVLEAANVPRAQPVADLINERFAGRDPAHERAFANLYGGAVWHMSRGDQVSAIAWLERAAELGMVVRELHIDPAFAPLLETAAGRQLAQRMRKRAETVRALVANPGEC